MKLLDIYNTIDSVAPFQSQEDWDNAGILVGNRNADIHKVLLALDVSSDVIQQAIDGGYDLIISHHPLIFHPIKNILFDTPLGSNLTNLCKNNISVICAHTNVDKHILGDLLIKKIGATVGIEKADDFLRIGTLEKETNLCDYIQFIKNSLENSGIRYYDSGKKVHKVGCVSGSGGEFIYSAFEQGCDTFVSADIKHNIWLDAKQMGINLIDADHFNTENFVVNSFYKIVSEKYPELEITIAKNGPVIIYG